ncbi:MAG: tRNA pseudouridine(38-40) synthase TruA [Oscillospiraceae bacterium]
MPNFRMTLSYDGTRYNGWQRQGNTPDTIQGRLEAALSDLLAQPVEVAGSGRTDAGVHARMQTASFRARTDLPAPELLRQLRARACRGHRRAHARGNRAALSRAPVLPRQDVCLPHLEQRDAECVRAPLCLRLLPQPLDTAAMQRAAALLCGTHDYTSFCANRRMKKSAVRTVDAITVERRGEEVRLTFSGDGFLYHMVRILTGTLLEVGLGQRDADTMPAILAAHDRSAAGPAAPARGLILWETRYAHPHPQTGKEKRE